MKVKACNAILDNEQRCNKTYQLHEVYLRDPYDAQRSSIEYLCRFCYDRLVKEMNERISDFDRKLKNQIYEINRQRVAAKEYDMPYRNESLEMKISDLRTLVKRISNGECRNEFCRKLLTSLQQGERVYTATTFRVNGKRHYTWNYCSHQCFKSIKGKCGVFNLEQSKQKVLA